MAADWALPDGTRQGGTVLVHATGMDEPGLHVATSRHRDKVILFAGRDQLETPGDSHDLGAPATGQQLERRVVAGLAEQARTRPGTANDTPVHDDLARGAGRGPTRAGQAERASGLEDLRRAVLGPVEDGPATGSAADSEQEGTEPAGKEQARRRAARLRREQALRLALGRGRRM